MLDPVLNHLHQARQAADWVAQMIRLDPDLAMPAAMPLIAVRLMGALGATPAEATVESIDEDETNVFAI